MESNPLVSVIIATWNAGEMLTEYSLPAVIWQSYKNLEIIVIDDGSTDDTEERVLNLGDPRIVYKKIERNNNTNWYATGTNAINTGLQMANGDWIAHLDDDDLYALHRIETLINFSKTVNADIIHHPFWVHYPHYEIFKRVLIESNALTHGNITTSTLFYKKKYKDIPFGGSELEIPGDWDKTQNILLAGGIPARCPEMLLMKNGFRECSTGRNRLYRPIWTEGPYENVKNGE